MGYKVEISYRVNSSENQVRIVEGTCPAGHVFESVAKYVPNPRCKKCYLDKVQKENLEIALNEGYEVKILVRNPTGRNSRTYFVGKCPNEHLIDMKVVDFISGGRRCSPCKKNLIAKRIEEIIKESRYNAVLERVAIESKDRDSRLFVVGNCPSGHPVRMNANSFEKGARCKGCVKYGFSTERPAIFYVISGEKILTKQHGKTQTSNRKVGKILKYGVFHPASGRLSIHESHGFNPTPLFSLYHSDSKVVATLEKKVKLMVQERSVASCKEHGLSFDGASESFYETDLDAPALIKNVNKIVKELELNYETSFKKISPQDALVIGGRSKSLVTKEKIDTILATMESGLSSTTTSKEHTHG